MSFLLFYLCTSERFVDVEGNKDQKDELTTYDVAWSERMWISTTFAESVIYKFRRLFWANFNLRLPLNWALFEDAPRTCAAFSTSKMLDDSSNWCGTSKTEPWATPVSTSSFTREAPITQARDMPPFFFRSPQDSSLLRMSEGGRIIIIV